MFVVILEYLSVLCFNPPTHPTCIFLDSWHGFIQIRNARTFTFLNLKCIIQPNGGENCTGSSGMDWDVYTDILLLESSVQQGAKNKTA